MKRFFIILTVFIFVLFGAYSSSAQEYAKKSSVSGGFSLFMPNDDVADEMYGSGIMFNGAFNTTTGKNSRFAASIGYMSQDGDAIGLGEVDASSLSMTHLEFNLTGQFLIDQRDSKTTSYLGAGISLIRINEELNMSAFGQSASDQVSDTVFGFIFVAGSEIPINKEMSFYAEASYNSADIDGNFGNTDVGGINLSMGLRFLLNLNQ